MIPIVTLLWVGFVTLLWVGITAGVWAMVSASGEYPENVTRPPADD